MHKIITLFSWNQGGLLTGVDPASFNVSDPLRLWIIQLGEWLSLDRPKVVAWIENVH